MQQRVGFIARGECGEEVFVGFARTNFDGVGNEFGCFLACDREKILEFERETRFPLEKIGVETQMTFRDVHSTLNEYLLLPRTRVI